MKVFIAFILISLTLAFRVFVYEPRALETRLENFSEWSNADLKIVFFSDLHAGSPFINELYIEDLVRRINAKSPDLILIGGDLLINGIPGGKYIPIEKVAPILGRLRARLGVYAVLGNHDWWNHALNMMKVLRENGIEILDNDGKLIQQDNRNRFWLVGIGDDTTKHVDTVKAFRNVSSKDPIILFMHDPGALFKVKRKFSICFAGHLHGGQIYIPGIGVPFVPGKASKEWANGWVDFKFGSVFVSKGIGTSIFPARLNALPEFVVMQLGTSKVL